MRYTEQELRDRIVVETELIRRLEASYPGDVDSIEWHRHNTEVRDAYWRRRNWRGYLADSNYSPMNNPG